MLTNVSFHGTSSLVISNNAPLFLGEFCGNTAYDPATHVCCCGKVHEKTANHRCCGTKYYDPSQMMCCQGDMLVNREGQCPWS